MGKLCKTGKSKQFVYDAFRIARETGEAQWVNYKGGRIKIHSVDDFPDNGYGPSGMGLVKHRGRIILTEVYSKDSRSWIYHGNVSKYIQPDDICAFVSEIHDK